jgi:hypothetical protein
MHFEAFMETLKKSSWRKMPAAVGKLATDGPDFFTFLWRGVPVPGGG